MITQQTTLAELVEYAKEASKMVYSGESFMVRDLFTGLEWNRIPVGLRIKLGSMFLFFVQSQEPPVFKELKKSPQNQQIYTKI